MLMRAVVVVVLVCIWRRGGRADQGFWAFNRIPNAANKQDQYGHKRPSTLPDSWGSAKGVGKAPAPYIFGTTDDILGGNSGSPVINTRGELVGLIFHGKMQSLPGPFGYDGTANRAIAVDVRGMLEALRKVYSAGHLADELSAGARLSRAAGVTP